MRFDKDSFDYFENIIHPNIVANKNHYLKNRLYIFKPYHGCSYRNKNGTNKLIDFKRGHQCITPTSKRYWKKNVCGRLVPGKLHYTRYMSNVDLNYFAKTKKRQWYDYKKKCYRDRKEWFRNKDPYDFQHFSQDF